MLALLSLALTPAVPQDIHFDDVSVAKGVAFAHEDAAFTFAMGGGVAWFDGDGDGDDELLLTSSPGNHRLFRNDAGDLIDVTAGSNLAEHAGSESNIGVACADFDGDGLVDVYLTNSGPNRLYRNLGGLQFEDVTDANGVAGDAWSTSAAWADFDLDGDLDLYVGNYIDGLNFPYHYGDLNAFYENLGDGHSPRFVERATELGIDDAGVFGPSVEGFPFVSPEGEATAGCTLSVCTLDYDDDGDPDLMIGNDFGEWVLPDRLLRNDTQPGGPLTFVDATLESGFAQGKEYNMGIRGRDYDHDGDWDIYLTNLGDNVFLENDGSGHFTNVTEAVGPVEGVNDEGTLLLTSWGIVWEDLDNDGWEDLYVVNGYIPAAEFIANDDRAEDHVWRNLGDGTFERVDPEGSGVADPGAARGLAWTDLEGDGDIDVYVMNNGAGGVGFPGDLCRLYLNSGPPAGTERHWLGLRLAGTLSNVEAIGTRVELVAGDLRLKRQVLGDPVFISSPTRSLHFGLGERERVDELTFRWPSGRVSQWLDVAVDQSRRVVEPEVLVESFGAPTYDGSVLRLPVTVRNDGDADVSSPLRLSVTDAHTGQAFAKVGTERSVPAGSSVVVEFELVLSTSQHLRYQGTLLERKVSVGSGEGLDERAQRFELP